MKLRYGLLMASILVINSSSLFADEQNEKLDAILKEIKLLNQRVSELEQKVRTLTAATQVQPARANVQVPQSIPTSEVMRLKRYPDVEGIIRIQGESPGSLIKGLHERERQLRHRHFLPEVFPQPIRIIPQP
jgi:hypothetical protein